MTGVRADVASGADWDHLFAQLPDRLDVLVNNAGHAVRIRPADQQSDNELAQSIAINLAGHPARDPEVRERCTQPRELGTVVADICAMPAHLEVLEYTVLPIVQKISPL
ncbi:MAG: hypothetical protein PCFJNLEI_01427 [Verrucomicrobiae bacterium]|nr:hypothetical protein [Verrucomicrobiae bacterium]